MADIGHAHCLSVSQRLKNQIHYLALVCLSLISIATAGCGVAPQAQNSVPAVKSISPNNVVAGGSDFTLLVSGSGFSSNSLVSLNGQSRKTTFVNDTQLKAVILASDIRKPGKMPLVVVIPNTFVPASNSAALSVQATATTSDSQLQITTSALPAGAVGVGYSAMLAAANGTPPYTWGIANGQLPPGVTLQASTGQISGTPSQSGTFSFSVKVTDSTNQSASAGLSANIAPPSSPVVTSVSPNSGPTAGGTSVMITGSNFQAGATVYFGGTAASYLTVNSSTQIRAVTPAHLAGNADVVVQNPNGESSTLNNGFTITGASAPAQSLLSGCTVPTAANTVLCPTGVTYPPAGWTEVMAQGFEGSVPQVIQGTVVTTNHNGGTHALHALMQGDGSVLDLFQEATSATGEFYMSFWDYNGPGATIGIDYEYGRLHVNASNGSLQKFAFGPQPQGPSYLGTTAPFWGASESSCFSAGCNPIGVEQGFWQNANNESLNVGTWRQYEFYFKANTCSDNVPNADGAYTFYINGQVFIKNTNVNLVGCFPFIGSPVTLEAAGIMTALYYGSPDGTQCYPLGSAYSPGYSVWRVSPFSSANNGSLTATSPSVTTDGASKCWGSQSAFDRWEDDIIILRK